MTPASNTTGPLDFRVKAALLQGVESCYDPELARLFAVAYESGDAETTMRADDLESQLKTHYKAEFNLQRFRRGVKAFRIERVRAASESREGWERDLIVKASGGTAPCEANAALIFRNHPEWRGKLAWNEFTGEHAVLAPIPVAATPGEPLKDHHDTLFQIWLQNETHEPKWSIDAVRRSIDCAAKELPFNPVTDYLDGLPAWDNVPRLPSWLETYCGAGPADSDDSAESVNLSRFISAIGERWWISLIARAYQPGCKVHHVLVLEGAKGIGKTSLVEKIFGSYYAFITGDVTAKDNQALLSAGVWGILMDELDVLGKSAMRSVKQWVTQDHEKFRPVWGHRHERRPRRCVFIATVNGSDWALEEDRRWWPVHCQSAFDLDGLARDRDMLMAEALHKYRAGQRWHFDPQEDADLIDIAKSEQSARVSLDVWQDKVIDAAEALVEGGRAGVTLSEVLDRLDVRTKDQNNLDALRVGRCLRTSGWERRQVRTGSQAGLKTRAWKYFPPVSPPPVSPPPVSPPPVSAEKPAPPAPTLPTPPPTPAQGELRGWQRAD